MIHKIISCSKSVQLTFFYGAEYFILLFFFFPIQTKGVNGNQNCLV